MDRVRRSTAAWLLVAGLLLPAPVRAHEGPPFPIIVDERVGPYVVSVWTDPDIGIGTFFVVLEPPGDDPLPEGTVVRIGVRPVSGRLPEVWYRAEPQPVRYGERHYAEVEFDQGEVWRVRVEVMGREGGGEVAAEVEATPDGDIGPIGLLIYALPFAAIGALWLKAVIHRRSTPEAARRS